MQVGAQALEDTASVVGLVKAGADSSIYMYGFFGACR
jgi:hypothetical protein